MSGGAPLVECVANVSEGRDTAVISRLSAVIERVPDVRVLHVDVGHDAHRTVFTFAGAPEPVGDAAIRLGHAVGDAIDMRHHHGAHPRIGALDVCPFVPVFGTSLERCTRLARRVASTLAHDLALPVFLYEAAAYRTDRRSLALLRRGQYEGLAARFASGHDVPDFGPSRASARLGATVVGARPFLIAWNVSLDTTDLAVARRIAARLRTSGATRTWPDGRIEQTPGRLQALRAVGWSMPAYGCVQVSMNLLDFNVTPLHVVFDAAQEEARREGTRVLGSELVGLVPGAALVMSGRAILADSGASEPRAVQAAIAGLGLDHLGRFDPDARILERRLAATSLFA